MGSFNNVDGLEKNQGKSGGAACVHVLNGMSELIVLVP